MVEPDPAVGALSVRWTGLTPTKELEAIFGLLRARSVDDAQESLSKFSVGAQNWVMGDAAGDILWTTHAAIPTRSREAFAWDAATYTGVLPCMVLPGDGTAEWTGTLPEHLIPRAKNPPAGYIATANNDPIGDSLDNDPSNGALPDGTPMYLGCSFDIGFREGRIQERIDAHEGPLSPEDCAAIQGDIKSALGARLVPHLLGAMDRADEERATPGTHPDLTVIVADATYVPQRLAALRALLDGWGKEADYKAAAGIDLDTAMPLADEGDGPGAIDARASEATLVFNLWLVRVVRRVLGDELGQMGFSSFSRELSAKALLHLFSADREQLATFDPAVQDSALWDDMGTPAVESRDERVLRALLDALAWLDRQGGSGAAAPRWGAFTRSPSTRSSPSPAASASLRRAIPSGAAAFRAAATSSRWTPRITASRGRSTSYRISGMSTARRNGSSWSSTRRGRRRGTPFPEAMSGTPRAHISAIRRSSGERTRRTSSSAGLTRCSQP
ncbi:penicillin acylase family protein [Sorangium sp. So ce327]